MANNVKDKILRSFGLSNSNGLETETEYLQSCFNETLTWTGHNKPITAILVLPSHKVLTGDEAGLILVWSVPSIRNGECIRALTGHTAQIICLERLKPPGQDELVVSGSADGTARVWSLKQVNALYLLRYPTPGLRALQVTRGLDICVAGDGGTLVIWRLPKHTLHNRRRYDNSNRNTPTLLEQPDHIPDFHSESRRSSGLEAFATQTLEAVEYTEDSTTPIRKRTPSGGAGGLSHTHQTTLATIEFLFAAHCNHGVTGKTLIIVGGGTTNTLIVYPFIVLGQLPDSHTLSRHKHPISTVKLLVGPDHPKPTSDDDTPCDRFLSLDTMGTIIVWTCEFEVQCQIEMTQLPGGGVAAAAAVVGMNAAMLKPRSQSMRTVPSGGSKNHDEGKGFFKRKKSSSQHGIHSNPTSPLSGTTPASCPQPSSTDDTDPSGNNNSTTPCNTPCSPVQAIQCIQDEYLVFSCHTHWYIVCIATGKMESCCLDAHKDTITTITTLPPATPLVALKAEGYCIVTGDVSGTIRLWFPFNNKYVKYLYSLSVDGPLFSDNHTATSTGSGMGGSGSSGGGGVPIGSLPQEASQQHTLMRCNTPVLGNFGRDTPNSISGWNPLAEGDSYSHDSDEDYRPILIGQYNTQYNPINSSVSSTPPPNHTPDHSPTVTPLLAASPTTHPTLRDDTPILELILRHSHGILGSSTSSLATTSAYGTSSPTLPPSLTELCEVESATSANSRSSAEPKGVPRGKPSGVGSIPMPTAKFIPKIKTPVTELSGHESALLYIQPLYPTTFLSVGTDRSMCLWLDGFLESTRRTEQTRKLLANQLISYCHSVFAN